MQALEGSNPSASAERNFLGCGGCRASRRPHFCFGIRFPILALLILVIFVKLSADTTPDYRYYVLGYFLISTLSAVTHVVSTFLWKKHYAFDFTPENLYYRQGILNLFETHMPYSSIQDVMIQQSVLERFVGLAKVRIENAAHGGALSIHSLSLSDANKITDTLKTTVLGKNTSRYGL